MISFYLIQKHCKKMKHCEDCCFSTGHDEADSRCLLDAVPERWPMMQLQKAYDQLWKEDKEICDVFYKQVADRMLDVMGINKKDGDEDDKTE